MPTLHEKVIDVLKFVHEFNHKNRYPPTIREVMDGCSISSTSVVDFYIGKLMTMDYLKEPEHTGKGYAKTRHLRLTDTGLARLGLEDAICYKCGSVYCREVSQQGEKS